MPTSGGNTGGDLTDNILLRLDELERRVKDMGGHRLSQMDRGNTATFPSPADGQTMVENSEDVPYWYSRTDDTWNLFGGGTVMQVTTLETASNQAIVTATPTVLTFDAWTSSDSFVTAGNAAGAHNSGAASTDSLYLYRDGGFVLVCCTVEWEDGSFAKQSSMYESNGSGSLFRLGSSVADLRPYTMLFAQDPYDNTRNSFHTDLGVWRVPSERGSFFQIEVTHTAGANRNVEYVQLSLLLLSLL